MPLSVLKVQDISILFLVRTGREVTVYFHRTSGSSDKYAEKQTQISFILVTLIDSEESSAPRQRLIQPQNKYNKDEDVI
jgi:hypothetical protein